MGRIKSSAHTAGQELRHSGGVVTQLIVYQYHAGSNPVYVANNRVLSGIDVVEDLHRTATD